MIRVRVRAAARHYYRQDEHTFPTLGGFDAPRTGLLDLCWMFDHWRRLRRNGAHADRARAGPSRRGGRLDRGCGSPAEEASKQEEGEVPLPVAETEQPEEAPKEVVVQGSRTRHDAIHDLVAEGQTLLRDVELTYVLTGKGKKQVLRGRPVAFALWSEAKQEWSVAHIELPRPPIKWKPGRQASAVSQLSRRVSRRGT